MAGLTGALVGVWFLTAHPSVLVALGCGSVSETALVPTVVSVYDPGSCVSWVDAPADNFVLSWASEKVGPTWIG